MKNINTLIAAICDWQKEQADYEAALKKFNETSKFIVWFKGLKKPRHPRYHSIRIVCNYDEAFVIELRYSMGLSLAVRSGDKAVQLDLPSFEEHPMLGARGTSISEKHRKIAMQIANQIINIL